jgi:hypothetical protein
MKEPKDQMQWRFAAPMVAKYGCRLLSKRASGAGVVGNISIPDMKSDISRIRDLRDKKI